MRKSKGFTLIELIITIAILGIIIIPLSSMVLTSVKFTKASSDKQRATNLAQKYMEQIKGADASILNNTTLHYDEGNFDVNCSIKPIEGYEFGNSSVSGANGSDSITCDYKILFQKGNSTAEFYKNENPISIPQNNITNPYINLHCTSSNVEFTLKDGETEIDKEVTDRRNENENGKIKIRIDILRDLQSILRISVDNESQDILELYLVKADDISDTTKIMIEKHGGIIRKYNDILKIEDDSSVSDEPNKRLYKVTVEVKDKKTREILSINKGYKTFLK